eukprot:231286_1
MYLLLASLTLLSTINGQNPTAPPTSQALSCDSIQSPQGFPYQTLSNCKANAPDGQCCTCVLATPAPIGSTPSPDQCAEGCKDATCSPSPPPTSDPTEPQTTAAATTIGPTEPQTTAAATTIGPTEPQTTAAATTI